MSKNQNTFVFMVTEETLKIHLKYGFCAIGFSKNPLNKIQFNTPLENHVHYSILADILSVRQGDTIFYYIQGKGFIGVFKVQQTVFFDDTTLYAVEKSRPMRIFISPIYFFNKPLPENHLFLTPERQKIFWLWYFNKMRRGGRGCTPLDPDARDKLIELIVKYNVKDDIEITQSLPQKNYPQRESIHEIRSIPVPTKDDKIKYENALKALMMLEFRIHGNKISHLFGDFESIEWFACEVPFTVGGSLIDILIYHKINLNGSGISARNKYTVIELKSDTARLDAVQQVENYCNWVAETLAERDYFSVQPVIVAYRFDERLVDFLKEQPSSYRKWILIEYKYSQNEGLIFTKKNY